MSDSPLEPALVKVIDLFRQQTHNTVNAVFAPSPVVKKRIESGETAEVVIVQPDFADELTKSGQLGAGNRPIVGHVGVGLGNRSDSPAYDISTPEKFRQTLRGVDMLVFDNVASGSAFEKALERLGIAETLEPRIVRTSPLGIFGPVLKGKGNDMAAGTIPLIATTPGIKLLGPLPGAPPRSWQRLRTAIRFLVSPEAKDAFAANGLN